MTGVAKGDVFFLTSSLFVFLGIKKEIQGKIPEPRQGKLQLGLPHPGSCGSPRPPRQRRRLNRLGGLFGAPWAHNKITMPQYWLVSVPLDQDAVRAASSGAGGANRTWEDLQNRTSRQDLCEASRVRIHHPARHRSKSAPSCLYVIGTGAMNPIFILPAICAATRAPPGGELASFIR